MKTMPESRNVGRALCFLIKIKKTFKIVTNNSIIKIYRPFFSLIIIIKVIQIELVRDSPTQKPKPCYLIFQTYLLFLPFTAWEIKFRAHFLSKSHLKFHPQNFLKILGSLLDGDTGNSTLKILNLDLTDGSLSN